MTTVVESRLVSRTHMNSKQLRLGAVVEKFQSPNFFVFINYLVWFEIV